jgi:hypothetical protein
MRPEEREDEGAGEQADRMEDRARSMEERSEELERDIGNTRSDWDSKKGESSGAVPGAQEPAEDSESHAPELTDDEE